MMFLAMPIGQFLSRSGAESGPGSHPEGTWAGWLPCLHQGVERLDRKSTRLPRNIPATDRHHILTPTGDVDHPPEWECFRRVDAQKNTAASTLAEPKRQMPVQPTRS